MPSLYADIEQAPWRPGPSNKDESDASKLCGECGNDPIIFQHEKDCSVMLDLMMGALEDNEAAARIAELDYLVEEQAHDDDRCLDACTFCVVACIDCEGALSPPRARLGALRCSDCM